MSQQLQVSDISLGWEAGYFHPRHEPDAHLCTGVHLVVNVRNLILFASSPSSYRVSLSKGLKEMARFLDLPPLKGWANFKFDHSLTFHENNECA